MLEFNRSCVVASGGGMIATGKGTIQMNESFILLLRVPKECHILGMQVTVVSPK